MDSTPAKGGSGQYLCVGLGEQVNALNWRDCCASKRMKQKQANGLLPWRRCDGCGRDAICIEVSGEAI